MPKLLVTELRNLTLRQLKAMLSCNAGGGGFMQEELTYNTERYIGHALGTSWSTRGNAGKSLCALIAQGNTAIGSATLYDGYLQVYVKPKYRRKGYGTALVKALGRGKKYKVHIYTGTAFWRSLGK